jgi:hypothetical protein
VLPENWENHLLRKDGDHGLPRELDALLATLDAEREKVRRLEAILDDAARGIEAASPGEDLRWVAESLRAFVANPEEWERYSGIAEGFRALADVTGRDELDGAVVALDSLLAASVPTEEERE